MAGGVKRVAALEEGDQCHDGLKLSEKYIGTGSNKYI
jgi:hypothetical protein